MSELSYTAGERDGGKTVYRILRGEMGLSASLVKRLKNGGGIFLNGEPVYTTASVRPGDTVSAELIAGEREPDLEPEEGPVEVLFENSAMLALNKPSGVITHPSRARLHGSLAGLAAGYLLKTGQDARCHVVNRLDRDTSGCVIFAKNSHWKKVLSENLALTEAKKEYIALLYGEFPAELTLIDAPIRRAEPQQMLRIVSPEGKRAVTRCERLYTDGEMSLVRFTLETGRTHQIRVHSAHMGFPVIGDALYGTPASLEMSDRLKIASQALHAERVTLRDPVSGELVTIDAPLREAWRERIGKWKNT